MVTGSTRMSIAPQRPVVVEPQSAGAAGDGARGGPASVSGQAAEPSAGAAPGASLESASGTPQTQPLKAEVKDFSFYYGTFQAVKNVSLTIAANAVTALIGPSGCGKTTLLRCFNRMHDLYPGNRYEGQILLHTGESGSGGGGGGSGGGGGGGGGVINVVDRKISPIEMRMRISMVFQKPNPFPKSIYENVAYGLRLRGVRSGSELDGRVEWALRGSALWDEVKDRLKKPGFDLSGGQQQRLCIARALAVDPEIVLFDEPTSALDPIATSKIEELIHELKHRVTIVIVTHNMSQAARVSDSTAFMYLGKLIEFDRTVKIFQNPGNPLTEQYVTGRFG